MESAMISAVLTTTARMPNAAASSSRIRTNKNMEPSYRRLVKDRSRQLPHGASGGSGLGWRSDPAPIRLRSAFGRRGFLGDRFAGRPDRPRGKAWAGDSRDAAEGWPSGEEEEAVAAAEADTAASRSSSSLS